MYEQSQVASSPDGRYYVHSNFAPAEVKVFGPDGRYLAAFGRAGSGPGEYRHITAVVPLRGELVVFDWSAQRATRLDHEFRVKSSRTLPVLPVRAIEVAPNLFALATDGRFKSRQLFTFSWSEQAVPAEIGDTLISRLGSAPAIAAGSGGTIWSAAETRYRLTRWASSGEQLEVIEQERDWFPAEPKYAGIPREVAPPTQLVGVAEDEAGRVWALMIRASADWKPLPPARTQAGERYTSDAQFNTIYQSVVEVFGARDRELLASSVLAGRVHGFLGPGLVYRYEEDANGQPWLGIYKLLLRVDGPAN